MVNRGIFQVPPESSGGGAERHGYYLANHLAQLGHEVHFVARHRSEAEFHRSVKVHSVPPRRAVIPSKTSFFGNILSFLTTVRTLVRERFRFDLIHCHGALAALLLSSLVGWRVPVLYTVHDSSPWIASYPGVFESAFRKIAYLLVDVPCLRKVKHIVAVSRPLVAEAARLGAPRSKVTLVPNGIRIPSEPRRTTNNMIGTGLFVGQLVRRKRVDLIISAASKLADQKINFIIIGDGPEKESLVRLCERLELNDRVEFVGYVDDRALPKYYEAGSFFIFPSVAERFGLAVSEAMAYGLPVLASRLPVYDGILSHGENALLFETGSLDEIVKCIEDLKSNSELFARLSSNAASFVKHNLSWAAIAKRIVSVYEGVLKQKGKRA